MEKCYYFFIFLLFPLSLLGDNCKYIELVKCFMEHLDDWAVALYESQDNIVNIVKTHGCESYEDIRNCVEDDSSVKHFCNKSQVIEVSRTVSDLLTHKKHSGTFLKSFYLLEYSCTTGRELVLENTECLQKQRIGQETLAASSYVDRKLHEGLKPRDPYKIQMDTQAACEELTSQLSTFKDIIGTDLCNGVAQSLMCKSLYDMFKNVYPDTLGTCVYDCDQENMLPTEEPAVVAEQNGVEAGQTGLQPEAGGGKDNPANHCPQNLPNFHVASFCFICFLLVLHFCSCYP